MAAEGEHGKTEPDLVSMFAKRSENVTVGKGL